MKNRRLLFILMLCIGLPVFAQNNPLIQNNQNDINIRRQQAQNILSASQQALTNNSSSAENIMLARSSADYRVTPGDVYTLTYAAGTTSVTYEISVDSSYRIRVSNLGIVNGAGKTFMQLKSEIETIVSNNYPLSGVQLVLTQPATFRVHIMGEVYISGEISTWALSRLSSIVMLSSTANNNTQVQNQEQNQSLVQVQTQDWTQFQTMNLGGLLTPFASLRDVSIRSSDEQTITYDLFKAQRLGDLNQDPYLRPGDEITFNRAKRSVIITGEVERPGVYQLLDGENIKELVEFYGNGFTPEADMTRLELTRLVNSTEVLGEKIFLTRVDLNNNYTLENYDIVVVPKITQLQPVVFVEGAVINNNIISTTDRLATSGRLVVRFNNGETYSSLVRRNIEWLTEASDTQNAYIMRRGQRIPINLNLALYDASYKGEVLVQENDTLVIPFRQYFVSVAGAVVNPGRYPYIPDRDWEYYIGLAGGFIPSRNAGNSITIVDFNGKRLNKTDIITPETTITARTNHFLYYFSTYGPVVTTALSVISTFLTIMIYSNQVR